MRVLAVICLILGMMIPMIGHAEEKKPSISKEAFSLYSIQIIEKHPLDYAVITTEMDTQGRIFVKFTGMFADFDKSAKKLEEVLEANKGIIEYISLSSGGGYTDSIEVFGNVIKKWKLPVLIKYGDFCISTCAYIVLYSPDIKIEGQLAFHTPYYPTWDINKKLFELIRAAAGQTVFLTKVLYENGWNLDLHFRTVLFSEPTKFIVFDNEKDLYKYKTKNKNKWSDISYLKEDTEKAKSEMTIREHDEMMDYSKNQIMKALNLEALRNQDK